MHSKNLVIDAIVDEIYLRANEINEKINSIYFGGGTPSILIKEHIENILNSIYKNFEVSSDVEITIECNPDDVTLAKIDVWQKHKINRISLGVQSFYDADLELMNRSHDSATAIKSLELIKSSFENYSIDLIYGIPNSSLKEWKKNIDISLKYNVPHISTYALTVEPKTALKKLIEKNKINKVNESDQRLQYEYAYDLFINEGFVNYEFSSFAIPGFECKNNLSYWRREKYIGLGPSAHSFDGKIRKWNIRNNQKFIEKISSKQLPQEYEKLSDMDILNEIIMIGLRTSDGIDLDILKTRFSNLNLDNLYKEIDFKINQGVIIKNQNKLYTSKEYKFMTDGIAADLFVTE